MLEIVLRYAKYTADRWKYVYILCHAFGHFFECKYISYG